MSIEGKKELGLYVYLYKEEESLNCTHVYRKVREDTMLFITAILRVHSDNSFCLYFWKYFYDIEKKNYFFF